MAQPEPDLSKCDLKVGIEIHQQLGTSKKLFCSCPPIRSEDLPLSFERRLRPSQSELGRIDPAAVFEFNKGKSNLYRWNPESSCLVEADEEPPHPINSEALGTSILIAQVLAARVIDEVHVMRKIVIDGSNTSGFQRTAVVGLGGSLRFGEGRRVGVQSITVEEDAARVLGEDERSRHYGLDRLGVPLVEIALEPIPDSAEDVESAALQLGRVLRSTRRVARGLGTIRQDLNISVMGGEVAEVKGVQKLNLIAKVVRYEAARQLGLIRIAEETARRVHGLVECRLADVTDVLRETSSPVLNRVMQREGARVFCISASGLSGLLGFEPYPGIRLGRELGEIARSNSLGGVIHSDEFGRQGVSEAEGGALRSRMGVDAHAGLVLVAGEEGRTRTVAELVRARLESVSKGVLRETRAATDAGETRYLRPRPGAARMYPETDIPDIVVTREWAEQLKRAIPEPWEETVRNYSKTYSLSQELALQLYDSERAPLFERLADATKLDRSVIVSILVEAPARLAREGIEESMLSDDVLASVVESLGAGRFAKESAADILRLIGRREAANIGEALNELGISPMDAAEVDNVVGEVVERNRALIRERGERAFSLLMGEAMRVTRGRVDGAEVSAVLRKRMKQVEDEKS